MTNLRTIDKIVIPVIGAIIAAAVITSVMPGKEVEEVQEPEPEPTAIAPASEPLLFDSFGSPMDEVHVGDQVLLQSEISNTQGIEQPFVYIVQVRDADGITISLSYAKSQLPPNAKLNVAQSWSPSQAGKYEVEIFVWDSIDVNMILSPSKKTQVEVQQ